MHVVLFTTLDSISKYPSNKNLRIPFSIRADSKGFIYNFVIIMYSPLAIFHKNKLGKVDLK